MRVCAMCMMDAGVAQPVREAPALTWQRCYLVSYLCAHAVCAFGQGGWIFDMFPGSPMHSSLVAASFQVQAPSHVQL